MSKFDEALEQSKTQNKFSRKNLKKIAEKALTELSENTALWENLITTFHAPSTKVLFYNFHDFKNDA